MFLIGLIALLSCLLQVGHCHLLTTNFVKQELSCNLTYRISKGCSKEISTPKAGLLHCLASCGPNEDCVGASLDDQGKCLHHRVCHNMRPCQPLATTHHYMERQCVHGTWNSLTQSCVCAKGTSGSRCNVYPKTCSDLLQAGFTYSHDVLINPSGDGKTLYMGHCNLGAGTRVHTYMIRNLGTSGFNRTWEEYVNGFPMDDGNLWAGLRLWNELCGAGCDNVMFLVTFKNGPADRWRKYHNFKVLDEDASFKFTQMSSTIGGWNPLPGQPVFGHCMNHNTLDLPFSTWDSDSDGDSQTNCAARAGSGWWYSGCDNPCNMLGLGYDHWSSTPQYQHFSVSGIDMAELGPRLEGILVMIES